MAEKRTANKTDKTDDAKSETAAAEESVQAAVDAETEQGFRGVEVDTTPNHAYTVAGALAGEATPEAAADPTAARHEASSE